MYYKISAASSELVTIGDKIVGHDMHDEGMEEESGGEEIVPGSGKCVGGHRVRKKEVINDMNVLRNISGNQQQYSMAELSIRVLHEIDFDMSRL